MGGLCIQTVSRKMENVDNKESVTGADNNRGDNEEDREEEYGQLGVDSGQVRKVSSHLEKKISYEVDLCHALVMRYISTC